jgi:4,5:9,10-diseco-3-hydroxy-5,9,17-trioxoandrosta-1(10),2-diene-4-oate hydrolase
VQGRKPEATAEPARAAVGAPSPGKTAVVDGVRLAYADEGVGPALLCLHAVGHGAGDFTPLRERLRGRRRVVALDWPGHGRSADDAQPASARRYAELLPGFFDAAGIDSAVLLGNSIGGAAAVRFAAAHPARVRGLVLANPGGFDRADRLARVSIRAMVAFFDAGARGARWFPPAFAAYYRLVLSGRAAAAQRARIVASAYEIAPVLAQAWRSFGEPEADLRELAPQVACPTLLAWARGDRINQLARCRAGLERFPNAQLETFRGGHAAFLEDLDAFAAALEKFLASL